ncbi:MAG TPA: Type 1 glutamine amidotransferase-like domain-containing protein [Acidimicrobiales bacterium]|nr:Type 1 glutamine amidotransferase-like domain-containing protein [Acidimicrobiales bacterium]
MNDPPSHGPLALIGGGEWLGDDAIDQRLVALGGDQVLVLPTAAAYENPAAAVTVASKRYEQLGATVKGCMVLSRQDAENAIFADEIREAKFIYLSGGSPLHLRVTLKDSLVFDALRAAWHAGALIAGSSAGAMVLTDPMIDPRGGAFTVGLGLVSDVAVIPHYRGERNVQLERTLSLAEGSCAVIGLGEATGVILLPDGTWEVSGSGTVDVFLGGHRTGLEALAGKRLA